MAERLTSGQIHDKILRDMDEQSQLDLYLDTLTVPTIDEAEKEMMDLISIRDMHELEANESLPAGDGHDSLADKDTAWKDFYWKPQPLEGFDRTSYILAVNALAEAAREKLQSKESISTNEPFLCTAKLMVKYELPLQWIKYLNGGGPGSVIAVAQRKVQEAKTYNEFCAAVGSWGPYEPLAFGHWLAQPENERSKNDCARMYEWTYGITVEEAARRFMDPQRLPALWNSGSS